MRPWASSWPFSSVQFIIFIVKCTSMNLAYIKHWGVKGGKSNWHVSKSMKPDDIPYCGALVLFYYINVKKK